jgi:hypothetical protein
MLNPQLVKPHDLVELMADTFDCLHQIFPNFPKEASADLKEVFGRESSSSKPHSFASSFQENLQDSILSLAKSFEIAEKIATLYHQVPISSSEQQIAREAICADILTTVKLLKQGLECWICFPQTTTLLGLGDSLLTLAQFLDEHIEKLWHLQSFGLIRLTHDLEDYRASRDYEEKPQHQQIVAALNIGAGAQYPYWYQRKTGQTPGAIRWRLDAEGLSRDGERNDAEAIREEQDRKKGFHTVKKGTNQTPAPKHPIFLLHEQAFKLIQGEAEMAEIRLASLLKKVSKAAREKEES